MPPDTSAMFCFENYLIAPSAALKTQYLHCRKMPAAIHYFFSLYDICAIEKS